MGDAAGWGVTRAAVVRVGQGRGDGLELVWRHRGDGYFLQFTWHPNRPSRALQGISSRAMASICVHRASRTPPDSTPGHIRSRDDLKESVTSIDDYAFRDCTNLTSTYIKATSLSIYGVNTFAYCPTIIYVPLGSEETYKKGWSENR